jgi:hypothetical protein
VNEIDDPDVGANVVEVIRDSDRADQLPASFEVMGRDRGFSPADRRAVVMAGVGAAR